MRLILTGVNSYLSYSAASLKRWKQTNVLYVGNLGSAVVMHMIFQKEPPLNSLVRSKNTSCLKDLRTSGEAP